MFGGSRMNEKRVTAAAGDDENEEEFIDIYRGSYRK